jgi:outer membrane immunogenic protein
LKLITAVTAFATFAVTAGGALAADLVVPAQPVVAPAPESFLWDGLYVGAQAGVVRVVGTDDDPFNHSNGSGLDRYIANPTYTGFSGGVHIGYNQQMGNFVLGAVTDVNLDSGSGTGGYTFYDNTNGSGAHPGNPVENAHLSVKWDGSARVNLGLAVGDRFLPYLTGGVAYGQADFGEHRDFGNNGIHDFAGTTNLLGWTIGVGGAYAVTDNVILSAEYRHTVYNATLAGTADNNGTDFTNTNSSFIGATTDRVQAGISLKF